MSLNGRENCCIFIIMLFLFLYESPFAQIGSTIPSSRKVDWSTVGYNRGQDNIPASYDFLYLMPSPSDSPNINSANIEAALKTAESKHGLVCVQFREGIYTINSPIILGGYSRPNIVLKGMGPKITTINYDGKINNTHSLIRCGGYISENSTKVLSYKKSDNSVLIQNQKLNITPGNYVVIKAFNGPWQDDSTDIKHKWPGGTARNYLGQIVRVTSVKNNMIFLQDDLSLTWSILGNYSPYIKKITPPMNVGIQDLRITSTNTSRNNTYITFQLAANCWVKNIESIKPYRNHIWINQSTSIEIRQSYFYSADSIGVGGYGYGINIDGSSTNNLVENNTFEHLRHSVLIHSGANRNVVGYNYSFDEYSGYPTPNGDFQLHGHYPYANLFEGNYAGRFKADNYWGPNGPYNTFLRNYSYYHYLLIQSSDNFNIIGNEFLLTKTDSHDLLDIYGFSDSTNSVKPIYHHAEYDTTLKYSAKLPDISYYYKYRPNFISQNFTWPPIGCRTNIPGSLNSRDIPAQKAKIEPGEKEK